MLELEGKTVIVTGAARGLGRSYALAIAREGATVVLTDRDAVELEEVKSVIDASGGRARTVCVDLSNPDSASKILDFAYEGSEVVDGLVNNAGVIYFCNALDETEEEILDTLSVNVAAVIRLGQGIARRWKSQGVGGSIVNITSGAQMGMENRATYCASKGAVSSLTYAWAMDLAPYGIRVNAVSPIATTRMWDTDPDLSDVPFHDPDQVAPGVVFLLSDRSSWLSGRVIRLTNGSLTVVKPPRFVEPASYRSFEETWSSATIEAFLKEKDLEGDR